VGYSVAGKLSGNMVAAAVTLILTMEAMHVSETLLCIYQTTRRHIFLPHFRKFISRAYVTVDVTLMYTHTQLPYTDGRLAPVFPPIGNGSSVKAVSPKAKTVQKLRQSKS
jgi:hypothetical protein